MVSKNNVLDFISNQDKFCKTKNKKLKSSIIKAKNMLNQNNSENKTSCGNNSIEQLDLCNNECQFEIFIDDINNNKNIKKKNDFIGKKQNRKINEKEIIFKIQKYFIFVLKLINENNIEGIKNEEKSIKKILELLSEYKIDDINYFIKESDICKIIIYFKYTNKCFNKEIQKNIEKFYQKIKDLYIEIMLSKDKI